MCDALCSVVCGGVCVMCAGFYSLLGVNIDGKLIRAVNGEKSGDKSGVP